MHLPRCAFATALIANAASSAWAASPGQFEMAGNSMISAMMMFLGNENSVYILDKAEANAAQINGHAAWGAVWDINSRQTALQDVRSNTFCASGMHLPNGSYVTFGGNDAVTTGGKPGSQLNPDGNTGAWDSLYQDFDGRKAIRIVNPCTVNDDLNDGNCAWYDEPTVLAMQKARWYSAAEATGNGEVVMIGGFVTGGFVNRWYPNVDPVTESGSAEPTYEYYPPRTTPPQQFQFLVKTSGLNAYAHTFLMPSGKFFVQANLSTVLWDHENNVETDLPDMPNNVARTYPASGATAMLPLTPANNWTPTMLFCGGSDMPEYNYGNYAQPFADLWNIAASKDCQRITPEPTDGSAPQYEADDDMLEGRTMGQFIALPDGTMLVVNGGLNGTAGYSTGTRTTPQADMPFGVSLAAGPVLTPVIYNPNAPQGSRWSRTGLGSSTIPRLYHSTAILLPDASVLVAGSNPNQDVDLNAFFPTEYRIEIFYPSYFSASVRPVPTGVPNTLSYGGNPFDITIPASSYSGSSNDAATATQVFLIRGGFTTHAMNMGQRSMQLNNTYTSFSNGTLVLHVAQPPPNPNLFQPGPALLFVTIKGIPSNGTYVILGNGQIGQQPTLPATVLPPSVLAASNSSSGGSTTGNGATTSDNASKPSLGLIIGAAAGGVALIALVGGLIALCLARRRRAARAAALRAPSSDVFAPPAPIWNSEPNNSTALLRDNDAWASSATNLNALPPPGPYRDESYAMSERGSMNLPPMAPRYDDYDPYGDVGGHSARNSDYYEPVAPNSSGLALNQQGSTPSFGQYHPGQPRS